SRRENMSVCQSPGSGAARGELVLEAEEVEEVQRAVAIAVRVGGAGRKRVLEAEEVEEIQPACAIAVRVALAAAQGGVEDEADVVAALVAYRDVEAAVAIEVGNGRELGGDAGGDHLSSAESSAEVL